MKELIAECKRGERSAQKTLYKMHYSFSLGICVRYTNSIAQAREVMNDGFMNAFQNIGKFNCNKPFQPWLKQILINCSIDNYQKEEKIVQEEVEDFSIVKNIACDDSILDRASYNQMCDVIRALPRAHQTVYNLRAIERYTHEEIAKMLNISIDTSKSNFLSAKEKLRKYLDADPSFAI